MTKIELDQAKRIFEAEEVRWNALKVGQNVYECGYDYNEWFEIVIQSIDIVNRTITGLDTSQKITYPPNGKIVTLSHFQTIDELKHKGIELMNHSGNPIK